MGPNRVNTATWHVYFATLLSALGYLSAQNPHDNFLRGCIAATGIIGTIAVPSLNWKGKTMTEQFPAPKVAPEPGQAPELTDPIGLRGSSLMGVTSAQPPAGTVPAAPEPPVTTEAEALVTPAVPPGGDPETDVLVEYITKHAALLEEMAAGLRKLLEG